MARDYLVETSKIEPAIVHELHGRGSIYANNHQPKPASSSFTARLTARLKVPLCGIPEHVMELTATYSPEDNKLRLYSSARFDTETYSRQKAAGFSWAPPPQLFVAPMWTPQRADLLIELCGEIGDENKSLSQRAKERADRFDNYSESRAKDAERARKSADAIVEHIPFGQPILIGHHSKKRARRDAERIGEGMRKSIKMWGYVEILDAARRGRGSRCRIPEGKKSRRIAATREVSRIEKSESPNQGSEQPRERSSRNNG